MLAIKKFWPLIVALVAGLIVTYLINIQVQQRADAEKEKLAAAQKSQATVVVAKQDIPANTMLSEAMLKEETVRKDTVQPRAAVAIDRVAGRITMVPVSKGEQILLNKVTASGQELSLSTKIPRGKRAITIPVDNISSVGGMIRPNDHVDIMGMVPIPVMTSEGKQAMQMTTMPLFQDVLVLAVGQEFTTIPGEKKEKTLSPVITLALEPKEANLIAFVQEQGKIRLVLRSPGDTQVQPPAPATWDSLFKTILPQTAQQQDAAARQREAQEERAKPRKTVEIIRGVKKEIKGLE